MKILKEMKSSKSEIIRMREKQRYGDSGVLPKFCFLCGIRLDEIGLGWIQCANEKCGALFLPFKDIDGNQNLMLQRLEKDNKKSKK